MNKYTMFLLTLICLSFSLCNVGCTNKQDEVQIYNTTEDTVMFKINIADDEYIYTDDPYAYYTGSEHDKIEQFYTVEEDTKESVNDSASECVSETPEIVSTNELTKTTTVEVGQVEVFTTSEEPAVIEENNFVIPDGTYIYCPSCVVSGSDISTFYCSNSNPWVVQDNIYYSKIVCNDDGSTTFKNQKKVLEPTANSWDSVHVCDPSVVSGDFNYGNNHYKYLMAYLGCSTTDNQQNNIGLAVSNNLDDCWLKVGTTPFISNCYQMDRNEFQWGVGQPSVIYESETGHTLLFYTEGIYNLTCTKMQEWDLSNLDNPVLLYSTTVPNTGTNDFISNADFAFSDGVLYMVCDTHPFGGTILSCVPDASCIYSALWDGDPQSLSNIRWEKLFTVGSQITGFAKNHNCGLYRDVYGGLAKNRVLVTLASEKNDFLNSLCTYRLGNTTW